MKFFAEERPRLIAQGITDRAPRTVRSGHHGNAGRYLGSRLAVRCPCDRSQLSCSTSVIHPESCVPT
eukprot:1073743-Prymnesium_polylepis.1